MAARRRRRGRRKQKRGFSSWSAGAKVAAIIGGTFLLLMTCGIVIVAQKLGKIDYQKIDPKRLSISEEVEHQTGVVTFALFGLDSRTGQLDRGTLSDTMIIAVLDRETKEITMSSVYRDTLVQMEDGSYNKANAAYAFGGPQEAISMLNRNFDLNIEDYVSVNFNALVNVIDALGGVDLDVTEDEVPHLNNYQVETSKVVGQERIPLEHGGMQTLNGVQAVSFARIRIIGGDQQRTERQRRLIQAITDKAQTASLSTINKIIDQVFPQISTSLSLGEILDYAKDAFKYKLGESKGFPYDQFYNTLSGIGSVGVVNDLPADVTGLHQFLYGAETPYTPSSTVVQIGQEMLYRGQGNGSSDSSDEEDEDSDYSSYSEEESYTEEDEDYSDNSGNDSGYDESYSEDTEGNDSGYNEDSGEMTE
ncbi:LCP family protein [Coprococcus sp. AF21-14LB]|uniref:LCP family protein n=1 Tax=Coprococcus sp. AF21-14LB TaxID=2292231 RepID=UPI000E475ECA|nr:LCP family protein [Coprococcus sp. AF21-14LB]RGS82367.1 LytR family transcriptional regulator [Coprococcus sp. AF21-14LB]